MTAADTRSFDAEIARVLHLMIHSLYTNKDIFLRELISNASDACDKLRYLSLTEEGLKGFSGTAFGIRIVSDKEKNLLVLEDNGIGMNAEELASNLGTIAKSGTREFLEKGDAKEAAQLIGQFGVGFYSCFMVADRVVVQSRRAGSDETWEWESDGQGTYTIRPTAEGLVEQGTRITLHLRKGEEQYADEWRIRHIVSTYSDHVAFPISYRNDAPDALQKDKKPEFEVINAGTALWMRPKKDITPEQYKEFYRDVAHQPDEPWMTLHHRAEGALEYAALLYIPSIKPFDLFHPDRIRRVKLYVKRVFITDQAVDIVPHWLRFLRGVVDSEDLPLNISRETLQDNPVLGKIRSSVTKKILQELKKKAEKEPEEYAKFWANFGAVLKEGLCEPLQEREQLLEVCRFATTHGDAMTGLDEYTARMKPDQDTIYYLSGDHVESLRKSPQIEGFASRGIEVLLLTDQVDDFWLTLVTEFKGKKLKSVTRSGQDLKKDDSKDNDEKKENIGLLAFFKSTLGDKVKAVRFSQRLTESAACLAVEEGGMDIRLERYLYQQKQLQSRAAKILELNQDHPILQALASMLETGKVSEEMRDIVYLLFEQAQIIEGEEPEDPAAFARRLTALLQRHAGLMAA
ncbi:MAG: molecular chaperone HtpG [Alphaproteobacteria bacterium]|nr:molecular chaperone HtpG [Alphaproteobacteria bacterium]